MEYQFIHDNGKWPFVENNEKFCVVAKGRKMTYAEAIRCKEAVKEQDGKIKSKLELLWKDV